MLTTGKRMMHNTIYLFLDWTFLTISGFLFWFVIGKTLSPSEYGIIATTTNFMIMLSAISLFGLHYSVSKLIPEYTETNQIKKIKSLIRFSLKIILAANIAFALLLLVFSKLASSIIKVPLEAVVLASIGIVVVSLSNMFGNILYGFQNMRKYFKTNLFGSIFKVAIAVLLIFLGFGYTGPLLAFIMNFLIVFLLRFDKSLLSSDSVKINERHVIFDYALPALISSLSIIVLINSPYIILSALKSPEITGIFAIAFLLTSPLNIIPSTLSLALFPITSQLSVNNQKNKQNYMINITTRYAVFVTLPIMTFLLFYSKAIILIFSKPEYLPATKLFPILAVASFLYGMGNILISSLYAIKKPRTNRNISVLSALLFLFLSIPLTYLFSSMGTSFAYLIAVSIFILLSYIFLRKYLTLTLPIKSILKIIFSTILFSVFLFVSDALPYNFILKISLVVLGSIFYLLFLIPLKFYTQEDVRVLEYIAHSSPLFKKQFSALSEFLSRKI